MKAKSLFALEKFVAICEEKTGISLTTNSVDDIVLGLVLTKKQHDN